MPTKKRGGIRVFYFFVICWNCVRGPCFKVLLKKRLKNPQNFRTENTLYFGESFGDSKVLFTKSTLCQGLGRKPRHLMPTKKTRRNPRFCYFFFLLIITALIIMVAADIMHIDKIRIVLYVPVSVCVPLSVVFAEAAVL